MTLHEERRRRVAALSFFPAFQPPASGGEHRYYHLYRNLGRYYEIDLISPTHPFVAPEVVTIAETVREHRVPKSWRHVALQRAFDRLGRFPECSAVVVSLASYAEREYRRLVRERCAASDIVVHEFPFLYLHARKRPGQLLAYDAHNVEFDLQRSMLRGPLGRLLAGYVGRLERRACRESDVVFVTSADDRDRLVDLYGVPAGKVFVAPNGVDVAAVRCVTEPEREEARGRLEVDGQDVLLFIGSFHPPNIEAVHFLVATLAPRLPDKVFIIAGGVTAAVSSTRVPDNVICLGRVSDDAKRLLLRASDVALNPMFSGSGTNLKMLEYLAAGLPVVATPVGARGLELVDGEHALVAAADDFPRSIAAIVGNPDLRARLRRCARRLAEDRYDWRKIAQAMYETLESAYAAMVRDRTPATLPPHP